MKGEGNFFLRSSSLNYICLFLKQKKHGFTAGRCLILYAFARAQSPLSLANRALFYWNVSIQLMDKRKEQMDKFMDYRKQMEAKYEDMRELRISLR